VTKESTEVESERQRLRITYIKGENLRFISHLDLSRTWERALRRAGIPIAYTKGFHPHPKMVFAAALPLGCTGEAEVMDIVLSQPMPPRRVLRGLAYSMPDGLAVVDVTPVYERAPALPTLLDGADYDSAVQTDEPVEEIARRCQALMARDSIPRVYRGKGYDLRRVVDELEAVRVNAQHVVLRMSLAAGERGTGRPDELLDELGLSEMPHTCHRRRLRFVAFAEPVDG
jgi:radical SAM-linked protein